MEDFLNDPGYDDVEFSEENEACGNDDILNQEMSDEL